MATMNAGYMAFMTEMGQRGVLQGGERLHPTSDATTVPVRDGEVLTIDGPFAETKEQIGRLLHRRLRRPRRGHRDRRQDPERLHRARRGAADLGDGGRDGRLVAGARRVAAAVAGAFREEWGRVVATLIRTTGDWDLAEECAQDAFAAGPRAVAGRRRARATPAPGSPPPPATGRSTGSAVGAVRRRQGARSSAMLDGPTDPDDDDRAGIDDDRLRLLFTCCHPALALEARVALTLRTLTGLTTAEIARAFLVPEATMAQRLVRAKRKIRNAGIPYRVPPAHALGERLPGVLAVVYLLFNEGYSASSGDDVTRLDLSTEAIRAGPGPGRPDARRARGRRPARPDAPPRLPARGPHRRARRPRAARRPGPHAVGPRRDRRGRRPCSTRRSAVAGPGRTRSRPRSPPATPRPRPPADDRLAPDRRASTASCSGWSRSPVVELNRAVAVGMADGPDAGLALVDALGRSRGLAGYHLLPATRADLLRRAGRRDEAAAAYRDGPSPWARPTPSAGTCIAVWPRSPTRSMTARRPGCGRRPAVPFGGDQPASPALPTDATPMTPGGRTAPLSSSPSSS